MSNIEKLPKDWPQRIGSLYEEGASDTEIRASLRMTKALWESLYNDPQSSAFREIVDFGRELAKGWWLRQGRIQLNSRQFNASLWLMNMKNRFGWSDKTEVRTKDVADMSNEQLEEAVSQAMAKIDKLRLR